MWRWNNRKSDSPASFYNAGIMAPVYEPSVCRPQGLAGQQPNQIQCAFILIAHFNVNSDIITNVCLVYRGHKMYN